MGLCYDWTVTVKEKHWIVSDPDTLMGKPRVRGTRLTVSFLLRLMAEGWSEQEILKNYPQLSQEGLRAALQFASEALDEEGFLAVSS